MGILFCYEAILWSNGLCDVTLLKERDLVRLDSVKGKEPHITLVISFKVRQSFAMLRYGTAHLWIETGRYENIALNDRIYQL